MRLQGTLLEWNEQQGYGYLKPNGQQDKVYVDVKAFNYRPHRPSIGDTLIVEVEHDGNQLRANSARFKLGKVAPVQTQKRSPTSAIVVLLLLLLTAVSLVEFLPLQANAGKVSNQQVER